MSEKHPLKEKSLQRLLGHLNRRRDSARRVSERFTRWRIIVFVAGAGGAFLGYATDTPSSAAWMLGGSAIGFLALLHFHSRLRERIRRMELWKEIKQANLACLRLHWKGLLPTRDYKIPEHHPYAHDIDIVGPHSLLRLIDTTVSTHGRRHLVSALLQPVLDPDVIERRQQLICELVPRSLFCDRLVLEAKGVSDDGELRSDEMIRTLQSSRTVPGLGALLAIEAGLATLTLFFLFIEFGLGGPRLWGYTFLPYVLIYFASFTRLKPVFGRALDLRWQLERIGALFGVIEKRKDNQAPRLMEVTAPFHKPGMRPSKLIRKIALICDALSVRGNALVHLFLNAVGPWDLYFVFLYERFRAKIIGVFPEWLEALGRLEAAGALARFADLHPAYVFARINRSDEGRPSIVANGLGHPLIPNSKRVVNDFTLKNLGSIMLLTGSNMSGKSTFLRTVGINACLAQAGGPVCARSFSMSALRVYCSVRIKDDLEEGLSYFYAEVKRLKRILDATMDQSSLPVLFLIDEIFKGTNNRERLLGSTAYIKKLLESRGLGLVTTHDLELASLEGEVNGVRNFHFQEQVVAGKLVFDYRLLSGPCPITNALRIMAREGLPVPPGSFQ